MVLELGVVQLANRVLHVVPAESQQHVQSGMCVQHRTYRVASDCS